MAILHQLPEPGRNNKRDARWPIAVIVLFYLLQVWAAYMENSHIDWKFGGYDFDELTLPCDGITKPYYAQLDWFIRDNLMKILAYLGLMLYWLTRKNPVTRREYFERIYPGCITLEVVELWFMHGGHGLPNIWINFAAITFTVLYSWIKLK